VAIGPLFNLPFTEIEAVFIYSSSFSERQRKWKEELAEELEQTRGKFFIFLTIKKMQFPVFSYEVWGLPYFPFSLLGFMNGSSPCL